MKELSDEDALKQLQPVAVGGEKGSLFEVCGRTRPTNGPAKESLEIIAALVHHPDGSWFYKISGRPAVVEGQKPAFLEFLKSIQI